MKELQVGMHEMQKESREQRGHIATIIGEMQSLRTTVETSNQNYRKDMDKLNDEINAKIAKLKEASACLPSTSAASSSHDAGPPVAVAPPAPAGPTLPGGAHRPTRIWIKGFKETLTSKYLVNFGNDVIKKLPAALRADARAGAPGFGAVLHLTFPAGTNMAEVKKAIGDLKLVHEDEAKQKHPLRTAPDVPLSERHRGRVLGELWKFLQPHLDARGECEGYRLGNSNGRLFYIMGERPLELFAATTTDKDLNITPNEKNLAKIGVTAAQAHEWVVASSKAAARAQP
jgi:hypothetical protein